MGSNPQISQIEFLTENVLIATELEGMRVVIETSSSCQLTFSLLASSCPIAFHLHGMYWYVAGVGAAVAALWFCCRHNYIRQCLLPPSGQLLCSSAVCFVAKHSSP